MPSPPEEQPGRTDLAAPSAADVWRDVDGTTLRMAAYLPEAEAADTPAVVVLHGLGTSIDVLREARPGADPFARLAAEGLRVLALDWPGHGRSGGRRGRLTYRMAMDAAAEAVACARERWDAPVGLVGTGLGGVLAFYAALEGHQIGAVACHNLLDLRDVRPVLQRTRQGVLLPVAGRLRGVLSRAQLERVPVPTRGVLAASDAAGDPALAAALRRHPQAIRRYDLDSLASILLAPEDKPDVSAQSVPTFAAVGGDDRVLPETTSRAILARLTCPTELFALPGGSHQLLLEHPEAVIPPMAAFLRRHLAAA